MKKIRDEILQSDDNSLLTRKIMKALTYSAEKLSESDTRPKKSHDFIYIETQTGKTYLNFRKQIL